jgi:hypothetical protein
MKYLVLLFVYFSTFSAIADSNNSSERALTIAERHLDQVAQSKMSPKWINAVIKQSVPLYRSKIDTAAYFEFSVFIGKKPAGFIIVSTNSHDFVVPHWAADGKSPTRKLSEKYGRENISRFLKEDVLAYGAELKNGDIVEVQNTRLLLESKHRVDYEESVGDLAKEQWKKYLNALDDPKEDDPELIVIETPKPSPAYGQFKKGVGPNTSGCLSGCGATAWGILFSWADIQAESNPMWSGSNGIYRANGGKGEDVTAPEKMDAGVRNMMWEIRNHIGTWCYSGEGATGPWNMLNAQRYLDGRSKAKVVAKYNVFGKFENRIKNFAVKSIQMNRTPVIIGTGWLKHYPVAISYSYKLDRRLRKTEEWFYLNQGWSGAGNEWVAAGSWFAGSIKPY